MNIITKKSLDRRSFLRGAGTMLALPMLDAMAPALSAAPDRIPRLGFVYASHGVILDRWQPATEGHGFELTPILSPLENVKHQINILSKLAHLQADTFGDGTGDHPRASAVWLTGVHAYDRSQPGVEVKLATSADQIAAQQIGRTTRLASLEMSVDDAGTCDAGDCFYVNTVSWRNETTPNLVETHPRIVFERLFGDGGTPQQRRMQSVKTGSILDSIAEEARALSSSLGRGDQGKLAEYMDAVREIETRIGGAEENSRALAIDLPERPIDIPEVFEEHTKLMFDLQVLAYQADLTRIFSMIMARELSGRTFPNLNVPEAHHPVSHHRNDPDLINKKARIDTYHVQLLSYFLERLEATPDGDGSLLDNSLILFGSGMGDGNLHRHFDLPCLLAGKLGGKYKTGYHTVYPENTPMSNLLVTILNSVGVPVEQFGDSTGVLAPDEISAA